MMRSFLCTFIVYAVTRLAAGNFDCLCNILHPEYYVLPCPDYQHPPIGTIDLPDHVLNDYYQYDLQDRFCKAKLSGVQSPAGWEAVYHYGQLGYLRADAGFRVESCSGTIMFSRGSLHRSAGCHHNITGSISLVYNGRKPPTTIAPGHSTWHTTKQPTTTRSPPSHVQTTTQKPVVSFQWIALTAKPQLIPQWVPLGAGTTKHNGVPHCIVSSVDHAISNRQTIFHSDARLCAQNAVSRDEALPLALCDVKEISYWRQNLQVKSNCAQIQPYTVIAVFVNGRLHAGDGSGIFMGCTKAGGFKIARQTCKNGLVEVVEINPGLTGLIENVDNYFVVSV